MTVIDAYPLAVVILTFSVLLGVTVGRIVYVKRSAHCVCGATGDPLLDPPLSPAVNRKAAHSAVASRNWRDSDHQTWVRQSVPVDQPGLHRRRP